MATKFNIWQHQGTILSGAESPFLPNVVNEGSSQCGLGAGNVFKMWYSGPSGNTYYAESLDGKTSWTKYNSGSPIISGQFLSKMFKYGGVYYLYTSPLTQDAINVYTCTDGTGVNFSLAKANAIVPGAGGAWDNAAVVQLAVLDFVGGLWYGYYAGKAGAGWKMGLVTSSDLITWNKVGSSAAVDYEGLSNFCFQKVSSTYYGWSQIATPNVPGGSSVLPTDVTRFSASSPSGPWTPLGSLTFYRTKASEGIVTANFGTYTAYGQTADPCLLSVGGTLYQYFTQSPDGHAATTFTIGLAIAPSTTFAQLVQTKEGIQNIPIPNPSATQSFSCPQLNTLASDNFARGSLGANWSQLITTYGSCPAEILSDTFTSSQVANNCDSYWNPLTWANDQWAQIKVGACSSSRAICDLRGASDGTGAYRIAFYSGTVVVQNLSSSTGAQPASINWTFNANDVLTAVVIGSTPNILVYVNGNLLINVVDTGVTIPALTSGSPGAGTNPASALTDTAINLWAGGDFLFLISGNAGIAGATVSCTGQADTTADSVGNYSFLGLSNGSYTITPSKTGYTFSPTSASETVNGTDITGVSFTATQTLVATPTFSPAAGTYTSAQTVTVSDTDHALTGFAMYWNTTGSPTTGSTPIANGGTITVSASETIYVLAVATGYANSAIGSAAYIINTSSSGSSSSFGELNWLNMLNWLRQI